MQLACVCNMLDNMLLTVVLRTHIGMQLCCVSICCSLQLIPAFCVALRSPSVFGLRSSVIQCGLSLLCMIIQPFTSPTAEPSLYPRAMTGSQVHGTSSPINHHPAAWLNSSAANPSCTGSTQIVHADSSRQRRVWANRPKGWQF